MVLFTELPSSLYLQDRLAAAQFVTPLEVQAAAIPHACNGKDMLATAQTGTGKTLAFLIPIMEKLLAQPAKGVQALVLVPTRELAMQINTQYEQLRGKKLPHAALLIGGNSARPQLETLRRGAGLIVATPGRCEALLARKLVNAKTVNTRLLTGMPLPAGMHVSVMLGDRTPSQSTRAISSFQNRKLLVLVDRDVALCSIHVHHISQIINYDLPAIAEVFIHRVGRTGRAG